MLYVDGGLSNKMDHRGSYKEYRYSVELCQIGYEGFGPVLRGCTV